MPLLYPSDGLSMIFFSGQPHNLSSLGLKTHYFSPQTEIQLHSPVFGPKPQLLGPRWSPLKVLLVMRPNPHYALGHGYLYIGRTSQQYS